MSKKIPLGATVFCVLLAVLITYMSTAVYMDDRYRKEKAALSTDTDKLNVSDLEAVDSLYRENYVEKMPDDEELTNGAIAGYLSKIGDKYAAYYSADQYDELNESLSGNTVGIGVSVTYNSNYKAVEVVSVNSGSPAEEAGVMAGDLIYKVGADDTLVSDIGYQAAIQMIAGDAGTYAVFKVLRSSGDTSEELSFTVERREIENISVTSHIYASDATVGVIRISSFNKKTPDQFKAAVDELCTNGAKRLVIDVRYNPGGELSAITSILDYLLPEGPIVRSIDKNGTETVLATSDADSLDMPMAVVVNSSTASAAELFASALKDYNKAVIVGTQTYGKGCMQTMYKLPDGAVVSITSAYYCPPFSDCYNGIGVTPEIVCEAGWDSSTNFSRITDSNDNQLAAAVQALISQ